MPDLIVGVIAGITVTLNMLVIIFTILNSRR